MGHSLRLVPRPSAPAPRAAATIVMPVLNGMPWLQDAIRSVACQADVSVELIVLDGGSTDGSREWLLQNAPPSAQLIFRRDKGQADAIASGLTLATASIVGWLNADDTLEPGALKLVTAAFTAHPGAVAITGVCLTIDATGRVLGRIDPPPDLSLRGLLETRHNIPQPSTFFRRDAYQRTRGLDRSLHYAMDVDLWLQLARIGEIVALRDEVLARFRVHPGSKSVRASAAMAREDLRVRMRHGLRPWAGAALALARQAYLRPLKRMFIPSDR